MNELIGNDNRGRLRRAGVFSVDPMAPGSLVAREVIKDTDIIITQVTSGALGLGSNTVSLGALAAGWIYKFTVISGFYALGTITTAKILANRGGIIANLNGVATFPVNTVFAWNGSLWLQAADLVSIVVNVTVISPVVTLSVAYIRSPYRQATDV